MSNWKKYKLEQISSKLGDGLHGTPVYSENGEYFFINGSNLIDGKISLNSNTKKVIEDQYNKYKKELSERTILLGINGTIGNVALFNNEKCILGKSACYINVDKKFDRNFMKYVFLNDDFQDYIKANATGSVIKNVGLKILREYEVLIPSDIQTQSRIASILSSLDDKIELNRRMNQTLEQIAQTIFKKYFFENGVKEVGLLEIASLLGGGTPKTEVADYWNGDIGWISAKDVGPNNNSFIIKCERRITQSGLNQSSAKLLPQFSTVITARGTVGNIGIIPEAMAISQSNYALKSKVNNCDFVLFQIIQLQLEALKRNSYGTVFDTITTNTLRDIRILIPEENVFLQIEKLLNPVYFRILNNLEENNSLSEIRNTLLPKLMSGEIDVDTLMKEETLFQKQGI